MKKQRYKEHIANINAMKQFNLYNKSRFRLYLAIWDITDSILLESELDEIIHEVERYKKGLKKLKK